MRDQKVVKEYGNIASVKENEACPRETRVGSINIRFQHLLNNIYGLLCRQESFLGRMRGSVPEASEKDNCHPPIDCTLGLLEEKIEYLSTLESRLDKIVSHLEDIA